MPQCKQNLTCSKSDDRRTWSGRRSFKKKHGSKTPSSKNIPKKIKLHGIHPMSVEFAAAFDYKIYRQHNRFLRYDGKRAAHSGKLAKQMYTTLKKYKSGDFNLETIPSFLGQFNRACDINEVSEGAGVWLASFFTAKAPAASLTVSLTPANNDKAQLLLCRKREGQRRIYKYNEDVNYLPNACEADDLTAKRASKIELVEE